MSDGERHLGVAGPFSAAVVDTRHRAHSVIHVIRLSSARGAEGGFYLKTLNATAASRERKLQECATEYRLLEDLSGLFARSDRLGVITPVACWPDDLAFLTEAFPGRNVELVLRDLVRRFWSRPARHEAEELCRRAGMWLATFQSHTGRLAPTAVDVDELMAYCELRVEKIQASPSSLFDPPFAKAVIRHLETLATRFSASERQAVGRHNDFRPDNMLAGQGRLLVVDFTGFTYGPRLYDFMKFWMRLEYMAFGPVPVGGAIDGLKAAFAEGYGHRVDLGTPMARFLRIANVLDKIWALADPAPRPFLRRLLEGRWHRHLLRELNDALGVRT